MSDNTRASDNAAPGAVGDLSEAQVVLDRHVVLRVLGAVTVVLVVLGTAAAIALDREVPFVVDSLGRMLLLNEEAVIPSWFASSLLLLCAVALPFAATRLPHLRTRFLLLAAVFVALSVDEAAVLHERATGALLSLSSGSSEGDQPVWIIAALPLVAAVGWYLLPVLRALPAPVAKRWWGAVAAYLGGAVVVEIVFNVFVGADAGTAYHLGVGLEEGLEMLGVLLFLDGLLLLAAGGRHLRLSWRPGAP